ncbi:MAG: hypothetical protein V3T83_18605 [Acidobacteriota bacterium]
MNLRQHFQFAQAADQFRRTIDLTGSAEARAGLGHVLALQDRQAEAKEILDGLRAARNQSGQFISAGHLAWVQLGLADHDQVFASLEEAFQERFCLLAYLKIDPLYDPIRPDRRFAELLREIGLGGP